MRDGSGSQDGETASYFGFYLVAVRLDASELGKRLQRVELFLHQAHICLDALFALAFEVQAAQLAAITFVTQLDLLDAAAYFVLAD